VAKRLELREVDAECRVEQARTSRQRLIAVGCCTRGFAPLVGGDTDATEQVTSTLVELTVRDATQRHRTKRRRLDIVIGTKPRLQALLAERGEQQYKILLPVRFVCAARQHNVGSGGGSHVLSRAYAKLQANHYRICVQAPIFNNVLRVMRVCVVCVCVCVCICSV